MSFTRVKPTIQLMLAEQLVGEARARRARTMNQRERLVLGTSAALYASVAVAIAILLPSERAASPLLTLGLLLGYAVVSRVRFEFGSYYVVPEQLVFVPMLLLAPLPLVPVLVAAAGALSLLPDTAKGDWARDRWLSPIADSWTLLTPVLVLAALAPGPPSLDSAWVYLLALIVQLGTDFTQTLIRDRLLDRLPLRALVSDFAGTARVDAVLSPVAFVAALAGYEEPVVLLLVIPGLVWLLDYFAKDRRERYAAALELNRAYRGTVMLLSDVLEFDDQYTADHSRSVVDLVNAVADELGVDEHGRQELEFAGMLHDIGKIAIPKEILNKPSRLTPDEFEIMKNHTIEGQFMLDRVGGLLGRVGEIVRSCHERWDGKGYPDGLKGEEIPLTARIVFVCDAYNAMTTDRPYREALSSEEALLELVANSGTQFDPRVVAATGKVIKKGEPVLTAIDEVRAVLASRPVPRSAGVAS
jgi:HD-GYP domain-containing protein (c-di-GMP phosphodiesterase class II)